MKKFFAFLFVALLATSVTFANNTATGTGTVTATVEAAITVTGHSVDLGQIGLGDSRTFGSTDKGLLFDFDGGVNMPFKYWMSNVDASAALGCTLTWYDSPNTKRDGTFDGSGDASDTYYVAGIDATGATGTGTATFTITVSAYYVY